MFDIGLTYLSVIASAVAASLPLVPVCLVAVPAALQLFAQVRVLLLWQNTMDCNCIIYVLATGLCFLLMLST